MQREKKNGQSVKHTGRLKAGHTVDLGIGDIGRKRTSIRNGLKKTTRR